MRQIEEKHLLSRVYRYYKLKLNVSFSNAIESPVGTEMPCIYQRTAKWLREEKLGAI